MTYVVRLLAVGLVLAFGGFIGAAGYHGVFAPTFGWLFP